MLFLSDLSGFQANEEDAPAVNGSLTQQVHGWSFRSEKKQDPQIIDSEESTRRFKHRLALLPECADLELRIERRYNNS